MLQRVGNVKHFNSKQEWEQAWHVHGRALGKRNSPVPSAQRDRVEVDFPPWTKDWLRDGITAVGHQANGMGAPEASYWAWMRTSKEVFSQLPLSVSVNFCSAPRELREILALATDPVAVEICYAKIMTGLAYTHQQYRGALVVITDSTVQPHDWSRYPRKTEERLLGIANSLAGVVLARPAFLSPQEAVIPAHEMFHLLGFMMHHENCAVPGYPEEECVMQRYPKTTRLCQRDRDALRAFWGGVEETTERRFLL